MPDCFSESFKIILKYKRGQRWRRQVSETMHDSIIWWPSNNNKRNKPKSNLKIEFRADPWHLNYQDEFCDSKCIEY